MPRILKLCVRCSGGIRFDRFTSPAFAFLGSLDIFIQPTKQILFPLWWDVKVRHGRLKWVDICTARLWAQMILVESDKKKRKRNIELTTSCFSKRAHTHTRVHGVYKVWVHFRFRFVCFFFLSHSALIALVRFPRRHPAQHTAGTTSCLFSGKTNDWWETRRFSLCLQLVAWPLWRTIEFWGENTLAANLRLWKRNDVSRCAK